jgi:hypothetical protein
VPALRLRQSGFSIVETTVALGLLTSAIVAMANVLALSASHARAARDTSMAAIAAAQKLEQLRALAWSVDRAGASIADTSTDTAASSGPPGCPAPVRASSVGTGLTRSPASSLTENTDGWVDYLDRQGCPLGGGGAPPGGTAYLRRWSVKGLPSDPVETLVLQVRVLPAPAAGADDRRVPGGATIVSVRSRGSAP